jgi:hypothetical protein
MPSIKHKSFTTPLFSKTSILMHQQSIHIRSTVTCWWLLNINMTTISPFTSATPLSAAQHDLSFQLSGYFSLQVAVTEDVNCTSTTDAQAPTTQAAANITSVPSA